MNRRSVLTGLMASVFSGPDSALGKPAAAIDPFPFSLRSTNAKVTLAATTVYVQRRGKWEMVVKQSSGWTACVWVKRGQEVRWSE